MSRRARLVGCGVLGLLAVGLLAHVAAVAYAVATWPDGEFKENG